jgi:hypothetical protein
MSSIGFVAALATFLGIWFGHVSVRRIEFISPSLWPPALISAALGAALEIGSLSSHSIHASAALGILGITLLWDALEFPRQQRRIQKGHAPANPQNPRHARILAAYPSATTSNLLKRHPTGQSISTGQPITAEEAVSQLGGQVR